MPLCHKAPSAASTAPCGFGTSVATPRAPLGRLRSQDSGPAPLLPRTPNVDRQPQRAFKRQGYELEQVRADRIHEGHKEIFFECEPWRPGQCAPAILQEAHRTMTPFRIKNYAYRESDVRTTIGEHLSNDTRMPYVPLRDHLPIRETTRGAPARIGTGTPRAFNHSLPGDGAFGAAPKPLTAGEPYMEIARFSFHGEFPPPVARLVRRKGPRSWEVSAEEAGKRRGRRVLISPEAMERARSKMKAAAYAGRKGLRLDLLFQRVDKDRSGYLDEDEVREAFRKVLRIPPTVVSDQDIADLVAILDQDGSGGISLEELVEFIGPEPGSEESQAHPGRRNTKGSTVAVAS